MSKIQLLTLDDPRMVERIRLLDDQCFPVKYSDDYYSSIGRLHKGAPEKTYTPLNNVAFFNELLVGSITSRMEVLIPDVPGGKDAEVDIKDAEQMKALQAPIMDGLRVYIMTLGVLERYRKMGIAQQLVQRVVDYVRDNHEEVSEVGLHVQKSNTAAIEFYTKKMNFDLRYTVKNYYTDIEPTLDAYYLSIKFDRSKKPSADSDATAAAAATKKKKK